MPFKWLLIVPGLLFCMAAHIVSADDRLTVAEYRADVDLAPIRAPLSPRWTAELYSSEETRLSRPAEDLLFLTNQELGGTLQRPVLLGTWARFIAVLDYKYQHNLWGDQIYRRSQSFKLGPSFFLTTNSVTSLYYGVVQDSFSRDVLSHRLNSEAERLNTGLAQTWYFADRDAEVRLGYEFEQGTSEEFYERMYGHHFNLSGRFPLLWGFNADLAAGYSRQIYPEYYNGSFALQSDRLSFNAGISRTFSRRLSGKLLFIYADNEFEDTPLSYRQHVWGLNLRYEY